MKKATFLSLLIIISIDIYPAYLENVPVKVYQPDGSIITCLASGDEYFNWLHDINNFTIIRNQLTGFFVYARLSEGKLLPTDLIVGASDPQLAGLKPGLNVFPERNKAAQNPDYEIKFGLTLGNYNNIVVFIRFSDQPEYSDPFSKYLEMYNSGEMSIKNYYKEVSKDQLIIESFFTPSPSGNTVLSYKDSHPRNYYIAYDAVTNPQGFKAGEALGRVETLIENAVSYVKPQLEASGLDFDINDDGLVDYINFVVQGDVSAWGSILWPHIGNIQTKSIKINDSRVLVYALQVSNNINVQSICHEIFHCMGAVDLYIYSNDVYTPVGGWDIMSSTFPVHMTTWMKYRYGRWFSDMPVISKSGTYKLPAISKDPFGCYKIPVPGSLDDFFVIEYRNKKGFDTSLPDSYEEGLLVYRVNPTLYGNAYGPPNEIYALRPGVTSRDLAGRIWQAAFAVTNGRSAVNTTTDPRPVLSDGKTGFLDIYDIRTNGDTAEFRINIPEDQCAPVLDLEIAPFYDAGVMLNSTYKRWQEFIPVTSNLVFVDIFLLRMGNPGDIIMEIWNDDNLLLASQRITQDRILTGTNWIRALFLDKVRLDPGKKHKICLFTDRESVTVDNRYFWEGYIRSDYSTCQSDYIIYYPDFDYRFRLAGCFYNESKVISGSDQVCEGTSQIYSISAVTGAASYLWTLPEGWNGNSSSTNISVIPGTEGGTILVRPAWANLLGSPSELTVQVTTKPLAPIITLTGDSLLSNIRTGNQWYFNSSLLAGATTRAIKPVYSGDYYAVVSSNGCQSLPSNTVNFINTGTNLYKSLTVTLFPNPNNGYFMVCGDLLKDEIERIDLYDNRGTFLKVISDKPISNCTNVTVEGLKDGLYFLLVKGKDYSFLKKLIIVN